MKSMLAALAAAALLAGGCGGDDGDKPTQQSTGTANAGGGPNSDKALQYSKCMRENGVPEFPDPENGRLALRVGPDSGIKPDSPEFQAARKACQQYAPAGARNGGGPNPEMQERVLAYARCMRENGVPNFPDPNFEGGGVRMQLPQGVRQDSPEFQKAQQACSKHMAGGPGGAP